MTNEDLQSEYHLRDFINDNNLDVFVFDSNPSIDSFSSSTYYTYWIPIFDSDYVKMFNLSSSYTLKHDFVGMFIFSSDAQPDKLMKQQIKKNIVSNINNIITFDIKDLKYTFNVEKDEYYSVIIDKKQKWVYIPNRILTTHANR